MNGWMDDIAWMTLPCYKTADRGRRGSKEWTLLSLGARICSRGLACIHSSNHRAVCKAESLPHFTDRMLKAQSTERVCRKPHGSCMGLSKTLSMTVHGSLERPRGLCPHLWRLASPQWWITPAITAVREGASAIDSLSTRDSLPAVSKPSQTRLQDPL